MSYDNGTYTINGERYTPDPNHYYGDNVTYVKNSDGTDCVQHEARRARSHGRSDHPHGRHSLQQGAQLCRCLAHRDDVDKRYATETRNGTATYKGSVTNKAGRIDLVSDVNGYTEANFGTGSRPTGFDTDNDGMPDAWETANGLNPNSAADGNAYTLDPAKYYTNIEVYANSLVQDIMLNGNADAIESVEEYYPAYKQPTASTVIRDAPNKWTTTTLQGIISPPARGMVIRVTTYPDGTKESRKVMID